MSHLGNSDSLGDTFGVVPLAEWVEALRSSADKGDDMERNPASKLVQWYSLPPNDTVFDTAAFRRDLGTMSFSKIGGGDLRRIVRAWKWSGFLR